MEFDHDTTYQWDQNSANLFHPNDLVSCYHKVDALGIYASEEPLVVTQVSRYIRVQEPGSVGSLQLLILDHECDSNRPKLKRFWIGVVVVLSSLVSCVWYLQVVSSGHT